MAQMDDSEPKLQIPDVWATKMSCPVCGSRPLGVFHPTGHADRFVCQSCETSFELENNGTRVRFVTLPQDVTPGLRSKWVVLEEALAAFADHQNKSAVVQPAAQPAVPLESADPQPAEEIPPEAVEPVQTELPDTPESPVPMDALENQLTPQPDMPVPSVTLVPSFMSNVLPVKSPAENSPQPKTIPAPFYEDDFEIPGIYPKRIKSELEKPAEEVWKNLEDERVENLLHQTPTQDSTANMPLANQQPVEFDEEARLLGDRFASIGLDKPVPPTGLVSDGQVVEEPVDLNNPPPVNPVEATPPTPVTYSRTTPRNSLPEEDLGILRRQIVGAGIAPTLTEKMQAASQRALELQRLGNTENEVRSILERSSGLTPEEVVEVLKGLDKPEERKHKSRLLLIFSIIAIIIFTLIAWWFMASITDETPADQQPGAAGTETTGLLPGEIISAASLPVPLQTLLPNGVRILNDPPSVEISTTDALPPTTCPNSKSEAAGLFGGPPDDWKTEDQNGGWVLVSQQQKLEIKVPTNMTAGYLVFELGPEMRSVTGPAIVRNVYMISISCQ